ncbi:MAG: methylmalonyl Co-A mutase-associated GTPase MeaB [Chloroflexi bacterium]|nr:methylmalonyl Co-A mutase-associated GTPase MeaB [Chloroflexota bacterium]
MNGARDDELIRAAVGGDRRALARLLSVIETGGARADSIVDSLYPQAGGAHLVGITGAPGTGKSTLVDRIARELRRRGQRVAVVAVDPSSPFTGGALLGDRVRMGELAGDPGVFVRSMASRGAAGGIAAQTMAVAIVLAAAGFETILIETVGVGQDELAVAQEAHTTVVVMAPGLGDEVQAIKAGILEIADVLVVNKADREGADRLVAELRLAQGPVDGLPLPKGEGRGDGSASGEDRGEGSPPHSSPVGVRSSLPWAVPALKTVATTGAGAAELVETLAAHRTWLGASGRGAARARSLAERHVLRSMAAKAQREAERRARASGQWAELVDAVVARRLSPPAAADQLLAKQP